MSYELPSGYNFVDQGFIKPDELVALLDEVVATADYDDVESYPVSDNLIRESNAAEYEELSRLAVGVRDDNGQLVAYVSATIDPDERHATADCLVIRKIDRGRGISRALVNVGLSLLDSSDMATVSFEPFGEIRKLVPWLVGQQGFRYETKDQEFCSTRAAFCWLDEPIPVSKANIVTTQGVEDETLKRPINISEMIDFRDTISQLVKTCVDHVNSDSRSKISANQAVFYFEKAGRKLQITEGHGKDYKVWQIIEIGNELIPSDQGEVISTQRTYQIWQFEDDSEPSFADLNEELEIRGQDGAMRPFIEPKSANPARGFTEDRHQRLAPVLRQLSLSHLIDVEQF